MVRALRQAAAMLPPTVARRWWMLVPLGIVSGLAEVGVAGGLFLVIQAISTPGAPLTPWAAAAIGWLPEPSPGWQGVWLAALLAVGLVLKALLQMAVLYYRVRVSHAAASGLSQTMLARYLGAPYALHLTRHSSELIRNCTASVDGTISGVLGAAAGMLGDILMAAGLFAVLAWSSPALLVAGLGGVVVTVLLTLAATGRVAGAQAAAVHALAASGLQCLTEALSSVKDLKVLGRDGYFLERFRRRQAEIGHVAFVGASLGEMPRLVIQTLLTAGGIFVFAVVAAVFGPEALALPSLAVVGYAGLRLLPLTLSIISGMTHVRAHAPAVADLYRDFQALAPQGEASPVPMAFRDALEVTGVTYTYPGAQRPALRDVSCVVRRGESLGILGPTGAGKSTLVDIVLGLLRPDAGQICFDGVPAGPAMSWGGQVGYVPQNLYLIDDSLRRNIAFGVPDDDIDEARVQRAVTAAKLDHVVAALPGGLDGLVGERGVRLSGGERQRVAIARALYHDPPFIVFDEATSALDLETEEEVSRVIAGLQGRTVLVVSHRISSLRQCTHLLMLRDGGVEACGTFDTLARAHAGFRHLVDLSAGRSGVSASAAHRDAQTIPH